jgi:peptidoglycan/xylan/chitin deacetylase (PgdA/CDA1 family)
VKRLRRPRAREWPPFPPPLAVVLGFHGVVDRIEHPAVQVNHLDLATFERVLDHVRREYEVISIDDVAAALLEESELPPNAAALTFDDAYRSVLELVDPLLRRHGLPYAVFAPSALIDSGGRVPTYVMRTALAFTEAESVRLPGRKRSFGLRSEDDRERASGHTATLLRTLPQPEVDALLTELRALLSERQWLELEERFSSEALMSWAELRELVQRGAVVGSHTHDHVVLHGAQPADELRRQVVDSRRDIEERLGVACRHFCYPRGSPGDVCAGAVEAVREAGYSTGLMNVGGPVRKAMDPALLPRISIVVPAPEEALAPRAQLSHSKWYADFAPALTGPR